MDDERDKVITELRAELKDARAQYDHLHAAYLTARAEVTEAVDRANLLKDRVDCLLSGDSSLAAAAADAHRIENPNDPPLVRCADCGSPVKGDEGRGELSIEVLNTRRTP